MGKFAHIKTDLGAVSTTILLLLASVGLVSGSDHPRLVSVDTAKCSMCHAKLTRGANVIHAPVEDDCTSCHDVSVTSEGTTVELSAPEPELCIMCHDGMEASVTGDLAAPHAPVADSCLTCHEPHAGDEATLLVMPKNELCEQCHESADLVEVHGEQITSSVDCTVCHSAHGSSNLKLLVGSFQHAPFADGTCDACHRAPFAGRIRLRFRGEKVCTACHSDFRDQAGPGGSIHGALEGTRIRAGCLSCHDPHMSPNPTLLKAEGQDLCGTCHTSVVKAANSDTGHAAAAEDCATCHQPHTSEIESLLAESTPDLCLMCHDPDDEDLQASHLGAAMDSLECTACHSPHGTGNEHLMAKNLHPVILDGCDTCHEGASDMLLEDGESDLCLACHDDIGEVAASSPVVHGAMAMIRCVDCHNPHASSQEKLINAPAGGECTTCHDDQEAGPGEVAHGVITLLGCRVCHEPHGGSNDHLLRIDGPQLCLACHDSSRVKISDGAETVILLDRFEVSAEIAGVAAVLRLSDNGEHGHPLREHRVLGTPTEEELKNIDVEFEGTLSCLTCHDPHKGRSRHLFAGDAASALEMCGTCHKK